MPTSTPLFSVGNVLARVKSWKVPSNLASPSDVSQTFRSLFYSSALTQRSPCFPLSQVKVSQLSSLQKVHR